MAHSNTSDTLRITDQSKEYPLAKFLYIFEDQDGELDIDGIRRDKYSDKFHKNTDNDLNLGYSASTFWLRFKVKNTSIQHQDWIIFQKYSNTHFMNIYAEAHNYATQQSGSLIPLHDRDIKQRDITFNLDLPANSEQTVYIQLKSFGAISLDINLLSKQSYIENTATQDIYLGIFYGILLIMAVLNLFFFFSFKEISYLYLFLIISFCTSVYVLYDGIAQINLNTNLLSSVSYLLPMFLGFASVSILFHHQIFLAHQFNNRLIKYPHNFLLLSWLLVISLTPFIELVNVMYAAMSLILFTAIYVLATTLSCWNKDIPAVRYAIIGWLIFGVGMLLMTVSRLQFLADHFVVEHYYSRVGLITLLLLLSISVAQRLIQMRLGNIKSRTALLESEMQRDLALEAGQLGIWRWQIASDHVYWSDRTCKIFGTPVGKAPDGFEEYRELIHPEDLPSLEKIVENAIAERQPYSLQHRIIKPDGKHAWVQCFGKVEFDDNDELLGTIGTVQDITLQKKLEVEKQQTHQLYEDIFNNATEGFVIRTLDGKTLEANPAIYNMYGYTRDEYMSLSLAQLVHPDSQESLEHRRLAIKNKKPYFAEVKRIRKDGTTIDVEVHATSISYKGKPHVFSIVHDITQRKQVESVIKQIAEGVTTSTGDAFFRQLVLQMASLFHANYAFISLIDKEITKNLNTYVLCVEGQLVDNITYAINDTPCSEVLDQNVCAYPENIQELFPLDKLLVDMNAESYLGTPLFDVQGNAIGVIVVIDIKPMQNVEHKKEILQIFAARASAELERMRAQNELKLYQDQLEAKVQTRTAELEAVNKELESFSYSVSHDLRSPLRAIDGFSKALMDDYTEKLDGEAHDLLSRVRNNTIRMGKLIDDLLNLSRLGRTKLEFSKLSLSEIANDVVKRLVDENPQREIHFTCTLSDIVIADDALLRIALENLLSNAWKYTANESQALIELGKETINGKTVYFVKDNGVGFDMNYADKLFGAFQRLHGKEYEGSGIGLATVQRIFHRHGGSIWAKAKLNEGATFFFTLGNNELKYDN